jgi:hypothetical protein
VHWPLCPAPLPPFVGGDGVPNAVAVKAAIVPASANAMSLRRMPHLLPVGEGRTLPNGVWSAMDGCSSGVAAVSRIDPEVQSLYPCPRVQEIN